MLAPTRRLAAAMGFVVAACQPSPESEPERTRASVPPLTLRETGLYSDWDAKTVAPQNQPFTPQYPLWSDGAAKKRWIHLPPGSSIDASNPDAWQFPIGAQLWKEFSFGGRVETRYMERTDNGWIYASYAWSEDAQEAVLVHERGAQSREIAPGVRHAIPAQSECRGCHGNGPTPVLGFSALQLSSDRDPEALHREQTADGDVSLTDLVAGGQLRGLPEELVATPPRIAARTPTERTALGYLHGNCGGCHRRGGAVDALGLFLEHSVTTDGPGDAILTTVGRTSTFAPAGVTSPIRIVPGDPDRSVLLVRMRSRDAATQMPPLGTRLVDDDAVRTVASWIAELPPPRS